MEPGHVFQLNFISSTTFAVFFKLLVPLIDLLGIDKYMGGSCPHYFLKFFAQTCINTDLVHMKMDRFLTLYWDLLYKDRVTTNMALSACFLSKVFAIMLSIDDQEAYCCFNTNLYFLEYSEKSNKNNTDILKF